MRIRQAVEDDVDAIMTIHEAAIRDICSRDCPNDVIDAWLAQRRRERQHHHVQSCSVWIIEDGEEVLAFGCFLEAAADGRHGLMPNHEVSLLYRAGERHRELRI